MKEEMKILDPHLEKELPDNIRLFRKWYFQFREDENEL